MQLYIGESEVTFLGPVWAAASVKGLVAVTRVAIRYTITATGNRKSVLFQALSVAIIIC